jgi:hypothetical protein
MPVALALLFVCALALQAFQAKPEEEKCSIEGRVVNGATGQPIRKATFMLAGAGSGGTTILKAASGDDGAFAFKDVPPGRYELIAERAGFARQAYGAKRNLLSGTPLVLSAGQRMKDLVFKMSPDAVISGRVLDEDGETVPGATVLALRAAYQRGEKSWQPLGSGQANDLGEFRLSGLGAGSYIVAAAPRLAATSVLGVSSQAPGNTPERDNITTYYPNATDPVNAIPVDVASGSEAKGTDVRLIRTQTVRVKGKVTGMGDTKQVLVRMVPKGAGILSLVTGKMTVVQETNGAFELTGVAPGSYLLTAGSVSSLLGGGGGSSAAMPLQVKDQHIEGIVLSPGGGSELPGAVLVDGKEAVKLDAVQVALAPRDFVSLSAPSAKAAEDGKFTLKSVSPDRYLLQVSGNPPGSFVKRIKLGETDVTEEGLDLTGGVAGSLQVTLGLAGAQVDGMVQGADEKPVTGATVVLVPDSRRYSLFKEVKTGEKGSFSFKGIAPGEYKILAWDDIESGASQDPEFLKRYESKAEKLSLKESDRKTLSLKVIPAE